MCVPEEARRVVVNWLCNVSRRKNLRSETMWLAVSTFDRYMATLQPQQPCQDEQQENFQCVAAACMHLARAFQESANMPYLRETQELCGNRYSMSRLRAACWRILQALDCDLYWPSPVCFYRFYSRALGQTQIEHTMTKFVVDSIAFARTKLLCRCRPSMRAACSILVARWCHSRRLPSPSWLVRWNSCCDLSAHVERQYRFRTINCCVDVCDWMQSVLRHRDSANSEVDVLCAANPDAATFTDSVLRRFAHTELFAVSTSAYLPNGAAAILQRWLLEHFRTEQIKVHR